MQTSPVLRAVGAFGLGLTLALVLYRALALPTPSVGAVAAAVLLAAVAAAVSVRRGAPGRRTPGAATTPEPADAPPDATR